MIERDASHQGHKLGAMDTDAVFQSYAEIELPERLRDNLRVAHQARDEDAERAGRAYAEAGIRAEIAPFFSDIPRRLSEAQLVISRSGASSIADISVIGRPAILIPFAAATGDHQSANARALAESGAAVVLPESVLDAESLRRDMRDILSDSARAASMAAAALKLGRPDAAPRLADLVTELTR